VRLRSLPADRHKLREGLIAKLTSIVLPVYNQADHLEDLVDGYLQTLSPLPGTQQLVLVPNNCSDASVEICEAQARTHDHIKVAPLEQGGWGRAVKAGLAAADGETLCYTNSARTSPQILAMMLAYAMPYDEMVLKANRRARDNIVRRLGSVIYNLECRALLDLATWDINGTPKVFPRSFERLLHLNSDDDMIDAEFLAVCAQEGYPVMEVPLLLTKRHGGQSTTNLGSAFGMYTGAWRVRKELPRRR
jgi:glycosyltransferase involved in cell wall biosynthesis